ncbi:MAG: 50S ribosomal protein L9 [Candidatus Omnitrophota bacterium]
MNVILSQDVPKLGKAGDVVKVKDGFARNFLIPGKLGMIATAGNLKRVEQDKSRRILLESKQEQEAQELAKKLANVSCTIMVEVNDLDRLYGSVTEVDIAKTLEAEGYTVDKKAIVIEKPIEELGIYEIGVTLHPKVTGKIRLWVTKK